MSPAASAALILKDHSGAVGSYFNSVRTPASFLAGAAFTGLFSLNVSNEGALKKDTTVERFLLLSYRWAMFVTFLLSTNTVVISTAAIVKGLHADFDPMSENGYMLLKRSFEYEFVVSRWSYLVSLLAFLVAVTNRILFEFQLFSSSEVRKTMGVAVCLLMSGLILHLISFLNSTLYCWNNLGAMTIALIKLTLSEISWERRPLESISIVLALLGAIVAVLGYAQGLTWHKSWYECYLPNFVSDTNP